MFHTIGNTSESIKTLSLALSCLRAIQKLYGPQMEYTSARTILHMFGVLIPKGPPCLQSQAQLVEKCTWVLRTCKPSYVERLWLLVTPSCRSLRTFGRACRPMWCSNPGSLTLLFSRLCEEERPSVYDLIVSGECCTCRLRDGLAIFRWERDRLRKPLWLVFFVRLVFWYCFGFVEAIFGFFGERLCFFVDLGIFGRLKARKVVCFLG